MCPPPHPRPRYTGGASFLRTLLVPGIGVPGSAHPSWQQSGMGSGAGNTPDPVAEGFPFPRGSRENCFPLLFKPLLQPVPPACVYSPAGLVSLFTCLPQDSLG